MASYPSIEFPNNIVPNVFNKNAFETKYNGKGSFQFKVKSFLNNKILHS